MADLLWDKEIEMLGFKDMNIQFDSKTGKTSEIAKELNDIKLILLLVAFKLDEQGRKQLITELSDIESESVQQWVSNLKLGNRN
ncbi:hypothetical protein RF656_20470 [Yersinia kristensenii]|uniref:hypothetical protein n=1 Tax=Yersinia TaxID=629 RepID=UPI00285320B5|nr:MULTISPECIES: hypothetical protein [Yersinia]MDR4899096.1 hypothetical protein [Yersinia kristensenii]MDR5020000.1 hypothetical protein [Yersinia rochesterensis]